jgi:hypothetical protein
MFKTAAQNVEGVLNRTIDRLESQVTRKVDKTVALINDDYRSLLVDQNIFRALSSSRDEIRNLLSQVDQRFEQVLRPIEHENTTAMDVDHEASATTPGPGTPLKPSNSSCGTPITACANRASPLTADGKLLIKREPPLEESGEDVGMRDA